MLPLPDKAWVEERRRKKLRRRSPLVAQAGDVLGATVDAAIPLHAHRTDLLLLSGLVEIGLFAALFATGSLVVLLSLVAAVFVYLGLQASDSRRVLAFTPAGAVVLHARRNGRPVAPLGPAPGDLALPAPTGLTAAVVLADGRWWVDRSAYVHLRTAVTANADHDDAADDGSTLDD